MEDKVYINGNVLVEHGMFYTRDCAILAGEEYKIGAKVISPSNGVLRITEDYGSIFTRYYIKGGCTCLGINDGNSYTFSTEHKITHNIYKNNIRVIERLLDEVEVPENLRNIYYQQQYVSVFGAMEYYLFETFMGQVCNNYDIYVKVLSAHLKCLEYDDIIKKILRSEHNINQEKVFIEQTKNVIYHNNKQVASLYSVAFDISVDLSVLDNYIKTRNDIVHRFGHTKKGNEIRVAKDEVLLLIAKVDILVQKITKEIKEMNEKLPE